MCLIKLIGKIAASNAERAYYKKLWEATPHSDAIFHRTDGKWYIELPDVPQCKCRLIGGSELFLDEYSEYVNYDDNCKPDVVKMEVYTDKIPEWLVRLVLDKEEKGGYRYLVVDGFLILLHPESKVYKGFEIWIGKGIEQIFGTAPDFLYISLKYT